MKALKNMTLVGKILTLLVFVGVIYGAKLAYEKFFPKHAKNTVVTTKATGLPPLAYDKNANAPYRKLASFNEAAEVAAPEVRGAIMGWNGFAAANYAVGGVTTAKGSLAEELGLNIRLTVQNSCTEQGNQLYAFAQELSSGATNPTKGVHFINWMGDGVPAYLSGLNARLEKDFGKEYRAEVVYFTGCSFGEDKWMLKTKYLKDARGSVTSTVIRDGDWNIAVIKSQLMGWDVNHDLGTYDPKKVNFVAAPNDDYIEAGKMYISGTKVTLKMVKDGKLTGKDTTLTVTGVASWFPVDQQLVQGKGGLVTAASTKDFDGQMGCAILVIKKWADDNPGIVEKMIEAFGKGGDQIKSHDDALQFASRVSEVVFADKEKDAEAWYKAYKSYVLTDDDGNEVTVGGSRAFSLADAAKYTGVLGGTDRYKQVYNTFGNIDKEAYPEIISSFPDYADVTDWKFLKAVYNRNKAAGTEGSISTSDFTSAQKGAVVGDANYAIQFNTGSSVIKPESYKVLDKIIGQLNVASNTFVEVAGHTDNTGLPDKNLTLSEARAKAVADYLTDKDPDLGEPNRLKSKGYGDTHPLTDNGSEADKARNRRVEIKLFRAKQ